MIKGFEEVTAPLNADEKQIIETLVPLLRERIGKGLALKSDLLINYVYKHCGIKIGGARLRKMIHVIRVNDLVQRLVATSKGYYVEPNDEDLKTYIISLAQRRDAIFAVEVAMTRQLDTPAKHPNEL